METGREGKAMQRYRREGGERIRKRQHIRRRSVSKSHVVGTCKEIKEFQEQDSEARGRKVLRQEGARRATANRTDTDTGNGVVYSEGLGTSSELS